MTTATCKLCFAPLSTCACVTDEHLAARFAAMRQPLLRTLLEVAMENAGARRGVVVLAAGDEWRVEAEGDADPPDIRVRPLRESIAARETIRVRQFPDVVAGDLLEWAVLAIEAIGDTPAARAATHLDHQRWVRQQLSLRSPVDTDAKAITDAVHERLFPGLARGAAERDARSGLNAQIFNLTGELLLWREVCGGLVATDDEARRTWLTKQVRLAEVYRHNLEVVASMLAKGRAYGGGPDDAAGYLAEVLGGGS